MRRRKILKDLFRPRGWIGRYNMDTLSKEKKMQFHQTSIQDFKPLVCKSVQMNDMRFAYIIFNDISPFLRCKPTKIASSLTVKSKYHSSDEYSPNHTIHSLVNN